ncbi:MAG: hypothetical protein K2N15_14805 [Lachnospiraceae bacterium]|nr:hypothetical protein [Lachnospiraceae bacterium]
MKKKIFIVLGVIALLLIILLVGWGKKTTYRGGNIALQFDRRKWYLTYREEEYPEFVLAKRDNSNAIAIIPIEDDGSIFERFHEEFLVRELYGVSEFTLDESKVDMRDEQGYIYYIDSFPNVRGEWETFITFGKKLENIYVIGWAQVSRSGDETDEESLLAMQNEMLEILSSITYSKQKKVWLIPDKRYSDDLGYWVWKAKQDEGKWEEPDRTRDSVPDEETAKRIAEDYDKECGWTERSGKDCEYEVVAVYLEQNYIWVLTYRHKAPEGYFVLDGGGGTVRIRRDTGEITDDTRIGCL